jgi:hypothetical protein
MRSTLFPPALKRFVATVTVAFSIAAAVVAGLAMPSAAASADWQQKSPATSAPGRDGAFLAYDAARGEVVLFGGNHGTGRLNDTWTWNGTTWTQRTPATSPSPRERGTMAYDSARGVVVLFGGFADSGTSNETWVWDGTTWTKKTPATSPPGRIDAAMAFDASRGEMVLFGGTGCASCGTWTWNGTTWTQRTPATSPPDTYGNAMAYDAARQKVVMFGGTSSSIAVGDTWTWDGSNWSKQSPATRPSPRTGAVMAYDSVNADVVLYGGRQSGYLQDTWVWNGTTWAQQQSTASPSGRDLTTFAFDGGRGKAVLFGGYNPADNTNPYADTWTYQPGADLPSPSPTPTSPTPLPTATPTVSPPVTTTSPPPVVTPPSADCATGTAHLDGFAGPEYVRVRSHRASATTTEVCLRIEGPAVVFGGKFVVTDASATLPLLPAADDQSGACATAPGNTLPAHPPLAGELGDPNDPPYLAFRADAWSGTGGAWVCVEAGSLRTRLRLSTAVGVTPPDVRFVPDPDGGNVTDPVQPALPSASCAAPPGATRYADLTAEGQRVSLYSALSGSVVTLCVRTEGAASVGGALTVDASNVQGALPSVVTGPDLTPCGTNVVHLDAGPLDVRRTTAGVFPASLCVRAGDQTVRITVSLGNGYAPASVTWTPDPGTPGLP